MKKATRKTRTRATKCQTNGTLRSVFPWPLPQSHMRLQQSQVSRIKFNWIWVFTSVPSRRQSHRQC